MNTGVNIYGNYFQVLTDSTLNTFAHVNVTIMQHTCNITQMNNTFIHCVVQSIPWGVHYPVVNILGYGNAMLATTKVLKFTQSVYSLTPTLGSLTGGQVLTITGRGFRQNVTVELPGAGLCAVIYWSSTTIKCRTPKLPPIEFPSSFPTSTPTTAATTQVALAKSMIAVQEEETQRMLSAVSHSNAVSTYSMTLLIDGMNAPVSYTYDLLDTPLIESITPMILSSSMTTNITIVGTRLTQSNNISIHFGSEVCRHVMIISSNALTCVLPRNANFGAQKLVDVIISIPELGIIN
jgi:hypothetical protein